VDKLVDSVLGVSKSTVHTNSTMENGDESDENWKKHLHFGRELKSIQK
jgi:hypothetical protein